MCAKPFAEGKRQLQLHWSSTTCRKIMGMNVNPLIFNAKLDVRFLIPPLTAKGTMPKLTQRFELGSNCTALKLPVVGTRLRCHAGLRPAPYLTFISAASEQLILIKKVPLARLRGVTPKHRVGIHCSQCLQINALLIVVKFERPKHIHMLPCDRRHPLNECNGIQIPGRYLLFIYLEQQRRVVVNDRIGNQPRAIVPDLLFGFSLNLELSTIDEWHRAA